MEKLRELILNIVDPNKDIESFEYFHTQYNVCKKYLDENRFVLVNNIIPGRERIWKNFIKIFNEWNADRPPSIATNSQIQNTFLDMDRLLYKMLTNRHGCTFHGYGGIGAASVIGTKIYCPFDEDKASPDWLRNADQYKMVNPGDHIYAIAMCILMYANLLPDSKSLMIGFNNETLSCCIKAILGSTHFVREEWNNRLRKIIVAINEVVVTLAANSQFSVNSLTLTYRLPYNTILKQLGLPLKEILMFWHECNLEIEMKNVPKVLKKPPPPPVMWKQFWSNEFNDYYYWNMETGEVKWNAPKTPYHKADEFHIMM